MEIKKGQLLNVNHSRKGQFVAKATRDFDTDTEEFYPVIVAKGNKPISGASNMMYWKEGESIPCRKGLCTVTLLS